MGLGIFEGICINTICKPVDVREESLVYTAPPMNMGCESREENDDLAHAFPLSGLVSVRNKVM